MNDLQTLLNNLEDKRLDYVVARSQATSDAEGYNAAGISKAAFYKWSPEERNELNDIAQKLKREAATRAIIKMQENAEEAAAVLIEQLKLKRNENVRQRAAIEILDRTIGKAAQVIKQDVTSGGETIKVTLSGLDD